VLKAEAVLEGVLSGNKKDAASLLQAASCDTMSSLSPQIDSYAFGLLIYSLLVEKAPYSNLEWDEAVRANILSG
jgi:hypothetical protein